MNPPGEFTLYVSSVTFSFPYYSYSPAVYNPAMKIEKDKDLLWHSETDCVAIALWKLMFPLLPT